MLLKILASTEMNDVIYKLVIETNGYAGNYSRELCALLTLEYAECEVGKDIADYERSLLANTPSNRIEFVNDNGAYVPVKLSTNINAIEISLGEEIDENLLTFILPRLSLLDRINSSGIKSYQKLQDIKIVSVDVIQETINRTHIYKVI